MLIFVVPAKINVRTSTSTLIKGSFKKSFTIFCDAHGVPEPTIKWFFNNEPIEDMYHHFFTLSSDRKKLFIEHLKRRHQGVFTCQARNQAGSDQRNFNMKLFGSFQFIIYILKMCFEKFLILIISSSSFSNS